VKPGAKAALVARALADLRAVSDPARREKTQGYFPTAMEILGVSAPRMRAVLRPLSRDLRDEPPAVVMAVAHALIDSGVHEARQVAFELVGGRADVMASLDLRQIEALGRGNDNWASVDCFGVTVAGPAWRKGRVGDADVHRWSRGPDPWWRRTAAVSTVALNLKSRGGTGDAARTLAVCRLLVADPHPLVRKGLSWALRSLVGVDADGVRAFLATHGDTLPALVRREVTHKLETGLKSGRGR
jgi:3-methyladenine DNA glycosylase AlkD